MTFQQSPPELSNQYHDDSVLKSYLLKALPPEVLSDIEESLSRMGALAAGELWQLQLADRLNEPTLTHWDAWGNRIDRIEHTRLWRRAETIAAREGLVATAYERAYGRYSRLHQFALVYLFTPSSDIYSCPLAMTDAAAKTLLLSSNQPLIERAVPHLTSRDPEHFWTSGQWMTEAVGGSDVSRTETVARCSEDGTWRLYGRKWFTSAAASQIALTLARPEGQGAGGQNLALFLVETRDAEGHLANIRIDRLKDKLGTRKLPTAELTLEGTPAQPVYGTTDGVKNISPMLNVTRLWNGVSAISLMRRGLALVGDFANKRIVFGAPLSQKPLHRYLISGLQAEFEGAFHLTFRVAELMGTEECDETSEHDQILLRLLTPIMKLTTAKQAVAVLSEVLEAFGGAGYVEDTGLPVLLRDAQVLPIWEGTTDVLALDMLRVLSQQGSSAALKRELERCSATLDEGDLSAAMNEAQSAVEGALAWFESTSHGDREAHESRARSVALTLGRALEIALLSHHAQWEIANGSHTGGSSVSAVRLSRQLRRSAWTAS
ncbi:MAG: acyl-CoA dehydrogenase family protein [Acidobacteriota bacterium]